MTNRLIELQEEGTRVGRWTTTGISEKRPRGKLTTVFVGVRCDCGAEKMVDMYSLKSGESKSCGCLQKEISSKHGMAALNNHTRFYNIWCGMLYRCNNSGSRSYRYYGGKGVRVEWDDFSSFKEDMLPSYENHVDEYGIKNTTIDRIDSDGNYSLGNCRWATIAEQNKNRKRRVSN